MMQLMEKRNRCNVTVGVDELHRWSRSQPSFTMRMEQLESEKLQLAAK